MNLQKVNITIKQEQKLHLEDKEHPWTLGSPKIILMKMENQGVSIAIYIDIWQRNVESQKRIRRQEDATNATKWDI